MITRTIKLTLWLGLLIALAATCPKSSTAMDCNLAASYSAVPIFASNSARANVLILFSNDHTNFYSGYNLHLTGHDYSDSTEYYGYFDPQKEYTYSNNYFQPIGYVDFVNNHHVTTTGRWSGNFLNWLTMCQGDFTRKAMTGGSRYVDSADHTTLERGDVPADTGTQMHPWSGTIANAALYTPYTGSQIFSNTGKLMFRDPNNNKVVNSGETSYNVRVEVCNSTIGVEDNCIYYENGHAWKPIGLMQRFMDKMNFGLMTYSYAKTEIGGVMRVNVHDISAEINPAGGTIANADGIMGFINGFDEKGWDPLAEMYYEAIKYFKALTPTPEFVVSSPDGGFQVLCNQGGQTHNWTDPISARCQKNFIIIVNDEYPSHDGESIPGSSWASTVSNALSINVTNLTKTVGDLEGITGTSQHVGNVLGGTSNNSCSDWKTITNLGQVRGMCPSEGDGQGTFYIAGLAYYAHINDLRSDFTGDQSITTYAIAFRSSPTVYQVPPPPMNQLYLATKYGGFDDKNNNNVPDAGEWEGDTYGGYTWPKNMAHAESGSDFEAAMLKIFNDILVRSSSGTAASLVTSSENGEGQLYQAYFEPLRYATDGLTNATWMGFMHSLWVDAYGNLREDTNLNHTLVLSQNKIVQIRFDTDSNTTVVDRYSDANGDGIPDTTTPESTVALSEIRPIWEASHQLGLQTPSSRVIKTFADKNLDGNVDTGEFVDFNSTNAATIGPFLQAASTTERDNIISYIRGTEVTGYRNRVLDTTHYLLGDIVHSSPTAVSKPTENYDLIYGDQTYMAYFNKYKNRPTYVYTGANDGMLHAFYGGILHTSDNSTTTGVAENAWIEVETGKTLGAEAWAYIPNNLLPHLKWLTCPSYPHVYYIDAKPKIIDARIFSSEWNNPTSTHPYGWGTILVCGMGFGGPAISFTANFSGSGNATQTFKSAYFAIDITNPTSPQLLWEKRFDQMGYTINYPTVIREQNGSATRDTVAFADQQWSLVLGNGPNDLNGDPAGDGYVYIVNLLTGATQRTITAPSPGGSATQFMAPAASIDTSDAGPPNYDVDAIYMGSVIKSASGSYSGKMYRIATDSNDAGTTPDWNVSNWTISTLIDAGKPITAAPALAQIEDKIWVYFGTGRYLASLDKTNGDQQAFYGIKDPCSFAWGGCSSTVVEATDLVSVAGIKVYETGYVTGLPDSSQHSFSNLVDLFATKSGFVRNLTTTTGQPSERIIVKPAIIGGLTIFTSFTPNSDVCGFSGNSYLYALYYQTGTAYSSSVIGTSSTSTVSVAGKTLKENLTNVAIGVGLPSQVAIHVGAETGGTTFTQMSTSSIFELSFTPAQAMKSGLLYWKEGTE